MADVNSLALMPQCSRNEAKCTDNIVQPSIKCRSRSVMVDGSGQGAS